jgi:hypothetical protein
MCDALTELLDDLDVGGGGGGPGGASGTSRESTPRDNRDATPRPSSAAAGPSPNAMATMSPAAALDAVVDDCAVLEVAVGALALEALIVYLALAIEHGPPSVLPYPLTGALDSLLQRWEVGFLAAYAAAPAPAPLAQGASSPGASATAGPAAYATPDRNSPFAATGVSSVLASRSAVLGGGAGASPCPPLLAMLRAADYLGVDTLRDLACAALASELLNTRDEASLATILGVPSLPSEADLEDVYSRFPFLSPARGEGPALAVGNHNSNNAPTSP